jgi:alkane 1-monooxygenase
MQWKALKYALPLLMFWSISQSFQNRGWIIYLPVIIAFVLLPLFESILQPDPSNLDAAEEAVASKSVVYDLLLYAVVPLQYFALYLFLQSMQQDDLLWWERLGHIAVMGLSCGVFGINVGHELGHRVTRHEQFMAKALLLTSLYTQFFIEHNKGHHKHVSTPGDPSSAPYRMSLYRFWIRSISGVYKGAWQIANEEMKKKNLPVIHWRNEMLQLQIISIAFVILLLFQFGTVVTVYYLCAAAIGMLLLETVNYIEHYGLARNETAAGKYERTMPWHSWNSDHVLGRLMLFELSRHSDHHYLASRKYQKLRHHDKSPQLPTGYPGSMIIATIPPLWFAVMDKQMEKYLVQSPTKRST